MNFRHYLFYKPYRVLCQFSPEANKQTLADYLKVPKNVYPVGRLDYDSEGLLLLSSDPGLNARILQPAKGHEREYWVQVEGALLPEAIEKLASGVVIQIDGKPHKTRPAKASLLPEDPALPARNPPIRFRQHIPVSWLSLCLTEGKNRQVRRMTAAVGYPTLRLVRWRIGQATLGNMQPGECREISSHTLQKLLQLK